MVEEEDMVEGVTIEEDTIVGILHEEVTVEDIEVVPEGMRPIDGSQVYMFLSNIAAL